MAQQDKINLRFTEEWEVDPTSRVYGRRLGLFKYEHEMWYWSIMAVPFIALLGYEAVEHPKLNFFGHEVLLTPGIAAFLAAAAWGINQTANSAITDLELIARREMRDSRA